MTTDDGRTPADVLAEMTEDERLSCLDGGAPFWAGLGDLARGGYHRRPFYAARVERLGVRGIAFCDGPRGVVVGPATCFPVSMARGATWDLDLEERVGAAIGRELRAIGADLYGGVCVNILRHPAWGRAQETYGEDPHHVGEFGAALTRGVQRHAMACVKHFACNSMENARFKVDVAVDEVALHEVFLPHFRRVVDEGVAAVMSAYNSVNNEWCGESHPLLTGVLRDEWGFEGFVISDWIFGIRDAARSLAAGLDIEMPYRMVRASGLRSALEEGTVSWDDVDRSVERVLSATERFADVLSGPVPGPEVLASPAHRALAREAAAKSVVVLRNERVGAEPVLPLDAADLRTLGVVGELAATVNLGDRGSSDVWAPEAVTVLDGLRVALPEVEVLYAAGTGPGGAARAAESAARADAVVVVVGCTSGDEGEFIGGTGHLTHLMPGPDDPALAASFGAEVDAALGVEPPEHVRARPGGAAFDTGGDRSSLRLSDGHVELVRAVAASNPRAVVAVVAGSAVLMSEWDDAVPGIVQAWYGGMEAGHALADVLLGHVEPSGRLPFSIPTDEAHLPAFDRDAEAFTYDRWHGWWHLRRQEHAPAYPFGFGLTYTTLVLDDANVSFRGGSINVTATVRNTGPRAGIEVVQVYVRRLADGVPPRLAGFQRLEVASGAAGVVDIAVPLERLAERDVAAHGMVVRTGTYEVRVARHAADPGSLHHVEVAGPPDGGAS